MTAMGSTGSSDERAGAGFDKAGIFPAGRLRALAALGGAVGALPLLSAARRVAERVFAVPVLAGAERMSADVKEATWCELAVLFVAVPAAGLFFGRLLPRVLAARGWPPSRAVLPGLGFAASFALWQAGASSKVALAAGAAAAAATLLPPGARRSRIAFAALVAASFAWGLAVAWRPAARVDLFEDGQILFGADALARGAPPYVDVYPIHGWGADGGLDALLFRNAPDPLDLFRARRAFSIALALAALAAAAVALFGDALWAAVGVAACLAFCPFLSERHAPALIAFALAIRAARSGRRRDRALAGAAASAALFVTLDFGVVLLAGGSLGAAGSALMADGRRRAAFVIGQAADFAAGAAAGAIPFFAILAAKGSLREFARVSFLELPGTIGPAWGLPAGALGSAFRSGSLAALAAAFQPADVPGSAILLAVLSGALVLLVLRSSDGSAGALDRASFAALAIGVVALRGVFGRADAGHRMLYGVFAGLPAAWLLFRAVDRARAARRPGVTALAAAAFVIVLRGDLVLARLIAAPVAAVEARRVEASASASAAWPTRGGPTLPRDQAEELVSLKRAVDAAVPEGGTFFDFGNEPALYFLFDRRPPIRYSCVPSYQNPAQQREVVAALERERPPLAILSSGTFTDSFDGVSNRARVPLVARYLDAHYRAYARVGRYTLGRRERDDVAAR
jgi:hypothetical protein